MRPADEAAKVAAVSAPPPFAWEDWYNLVGGRSIRIDKVDEYLHLIYDDQVIQTFYVSHADATDLSQILSAIIRLPGIPVQPIIQVNKANNTITVRASTNVAQILEKLIAQHDKPKAEIVIDASVLSAETACEQIINYLREHHYV